MRILIWRILSKFKSFITYFFNRLISLNGYAIHFILSLTNDLSQPSCYVLQLDHIPLEVIEVHYLEQLQVVHHWWIRHPFVRCHDRTLHLLRSRKFGIPSHAINLQSFNFSFNFVTFSFFLITNFTKTKTNSILLKRLFSNLYPHIFPGSSVSKTYSQNLKDWMLFLKKVTSLSPSAHIITMPQHMNTKTINLFSIFREPPWSAWWALDLYCDADLAVCVLHEF